MIPLKRKMKHMNSEDLKGTKKEKSLGVWQLHLIY